MSVVILEREETDLEYFRRCVCAAWVASESLGLVGCGR